MNVTNQHIRKQLMSTLSTTIASGVEVLGEEEVASMLREMADELEIGEGRRCCTFSTDAGRPTVTICYQTSHRLEQELGTLTETGALLLDIDQTPTLMEELHVVICREEIDQQVSLTGRAVHQSPQGVVVEMSSVDSGAARELQRLIKATPEPRPEPEPQPVVVDSPATRPMVIPMTGEISQAVWIQPPDQGLLEHQGSLIRTWKAGDRPLEQLLTEVADVSEGYGILNLESSDCRYQLVLQGRSLIEFRTDPPQARQALLQALQRLTGLTEAQTDPAHQLAEEQGLNLDDALVDAGLVDNDTLVLATEQRLTYQLNQLCKAAVTEATLYSLDRRPIPQLRCTLPLVALIIQRAHAILLAKSVEDLEARGEQLEGLMLKGARERFPPEVDGDAFGMREARFFELLCDKFRGLRELQRVGNLSTTQTLALVLLLEQFDLLDTKEREKDSADLRRIDDLYRHMQRSKDHFEFFQLHWSAFDEEVRERFAVLQQRLEVPDEVHQRRGEVIAEIRQRLQEAYEVLSNRNRRRIYREETVDAYARRNALTMYEKKLDSLQMRADKTDLLECLKRIVELRPNHPVAVPMLSSLKQYLQAQGQR